MSLGRGVGDIVLVVGCDCIAQAFWGISYSGR